MKVTVVGYWGGYPEKGGATSCYLFEENDFKLVVDIGSGALSLLPNFTQLQEINSVLISHYHHDHIADLGVLQYFKLINQGNNASLLPIYGHNLDQVGFTKLTHPNATEGIVYDPSQKLTVGPFNVSFLKTNHPVDCFAMRIETASASVVYTADSSYKEEFIPFSLDADLLICDCNFYEHQDGTKAGHMSSKEVATIASNANVKELLLSHLPHFGTIDELVLEAKKYYNGPVQLAKTGLIWKN
ncbi:MBL fold metallo-hydrolase [Bacillus sp. RG28]|uniref:MBL fold metallo-hydrolase n=1 Tax=Gottfriedia endophytica TaxID=2820819 RepID=A0A940SFZ5_9BACI|nr:MBL fold metallo-hydrolase [Gottfriedia endophytica]MBP0724532.1 MBL fold metallo-hydrolase [Gottfriedia endophytica]